MNVKRVDVNYSVRASEVAKVLTALYGPCEPIGRSALRYEEKLCDAEGPGFRIVDVTPVEAPRDPFKDPAHGDFPAPGVVLNDLCARGHLPSGRYLFVEDL